MKYTYKYYDDGDGSQWLTIKIDVEEVFNNPEFPFSDDEAKEIYQLIISDDDGMQDFLKECLQEDDIPTMSQLAQNGEI